MAGSGIGLLSWKRAALYLGLSESTLRRLVGAGEIPPPVLVTEGRKGFPFEEIEEDPPLWEGGVVGRERLAVSSHAIDLAADQAHPPLIIEAAQLLFEFAGQPEIVGVEESHEPPFRSADPAVASGGGADVLLNDETDWGTVRRHDLTGAIL